jgi:hypothetical protein
MAGRPNKLTPRIKAKILKALRAGNFREVAAKYAGVVPSTLRLWMQKGKAGESPYAAFSASVEEAETNAEIEAVDTILEVGKQDIKHLEWWLRHKYPERWGSDRVKMVALEERVKALEHGHLAANPSKAEPAREAPATDSGIHEGRAIEDEVDPG